MSVYVAIAGIATLGPGASYMEIMAAGGGIMNTGMTGNVVRNNIFALSGQEAAWRYSWTKEPPSVVERNIFYLTQGELFHEDGGASDFRSRWDHNLYWHAGQEVRVYAPGNEPYAQWFRPWAFWRDLGFDQASLIADPQFVDTQRHDYRLRPTSPALKLGFEPIDLSTVGPRPCATR